jgi:hypothetical protein
VNAKNPPNPHDIFSKEVLSNRENAIDFSMVFFRRTLDPVLISIADAFASGLSQADLGTAFSVASRNGKRASDFAKTHGIERSTAGYDALLSDPEVDAAHPRRRFGGSADDPGFFRIRRGQPG